MQIGAILYGLLSALLALVGSLADGGDTFARFLLTLLHPLSAVGMLAVVFVRSLGKLLVAPVAALLLATILSDGYFAFAIVSGSMEGDWAIPALLAVAPVMGLAYTLLLMVSDEPPAEEG